jgi:hypothetical protein
MLQKHAIKTEYFPPDGTRYRGRDSWAEDHKPSDRSTSFLRAALIATLCGGMTYGAYRIIGQPLLEMVTVNARLPQDCTPLSFWDVAKTELRIALGDKVAPERVLWRHCHRPALNETHI